MDQFSHDDLALLLQKSETDSSSPSVTLYLPAHPVGSDVQQDPIRLAKLIRHAEAELEHRGLRRREVDALLGPARALVDDVRFWRQEGGGVAAFLRTGWWRVFRLPLAFDEVAVVRDHFHVLPLLPLLTDDGDFFVLALSENEATLYAGNRAGLRAVAVPGLPHGVRDALRYDEPQKQHGHHLGVRLGAKLRPVLHGQGVGGEVQKERLGRYLHAVDHAVSSVLRHERAPLVLAGVDRIRAGYRQVTGYPHVLADGVAGSPDRVAAADLHSRTWPLVAGIFTRARCGAVATVREELGTGLASDDLAEIARAASTGGVATLLLRDEPSAATREQLEPVVAHTIHGGGTVYVVPADEMPGTGPVAAVLRR